LLTAFDMTDGADSITVKFFAQPEKYGDDFKDLLRKGNSLKILGRVQFDEFSKEINVMAKELAPSGFKLSARKDNAEKKRVELHLHTNMSQMDATNTATQYIKRAKDWGHPAVAITDHGVVQAFPEAMEAAKKHGIKVIYGVEAYLMDDLGAIVKSPREKTLDDDFVVFDIETTGLKKETCEIIEIGAVRVSGGKITETFNELINPHVLLPTKIIELTKITDDMLKDKPPIDEVLPRFFSFVGDAALIAHNAAFDTGFIQQNALKIGLSLNHTVLCTVELARMLLPGLQNHKLGTLAKHFEVSLENHHRASDDAAATAEIFLKCAAMLREKGVYRLKEVNLLAGETMDKKKLKHYHAIILVQNSIGLRNLYELVSNAHIAHYNKRPRIPKSDYIRHKEGLIIGTACEAGEFYKAVRDKMPTDYIAELAEFYDYFEIQPIANNAYLVREGIVADRQGLIGINKKIVELGDFYQKPVVATCDVHFMNPEDEVYRRILLAGSGFKDADESTPLYFRSTTEMLEEFSYLGTEKAEEVVITNTNKIADMIETIKPIPDETFPPKIEGAEEQIKEITLAKAHELYGDPLPALVEDRLDRELTSIIKNGFSVMYIIAQKLVWKSVADGYLVGSRGSVGSSFVATMSGITEVNPLPPHYLCSKCKYSDFDSPEVKAFSGASGCDMPEKNCPVCGHPLDREGHDIPFETFLGFDGDKEPDIDLNFSGEYQAKAHAYTEELFGTGYVFKAGTIGTLAEKTAFGYVKKYMDERQMTHRNAEINRLVLGCTGIKKTTGQHPGGLMVVPSDQSIYNFCPIQRPANDVNSDVTTTHFDYHSISGRLLKLDILGHDVPTIIRMLHDFTGIDPRTADLGDKGVMSLFTSPEALGVSADAINCKTGTLGLPEFGTSFVRQMLLDTRPNSFSELVRISGLSHGTDVWFNNAQELIKDGVATLKEVIPTRDDIMVYLIIKGVEKKAAFKIMENVRKGRGLRDDEVEVMKAADVPEWYIESCRRIKYMFPKGHAVAYVMMTVRIGYFKIHHPLAFYAASFSVKVDAFDYEKMCKGKDAVRMEMRRINGLGKEATAKEKDSLTMLELVLELYERGLKFAPLDLYHSDAMKFKIKDDAILPPLCSVQGLGENAALNIAAAREDGEFISIQDFRDRTRISKTVIEILKENQILKGIPETNQLSLF
ncbi:MAG: PolC-type DNA polymerase III, partial [Clostridiales bacterium]|nr:PolC-type DNA polymerase III [Clostridiales bacterium]